MIPGKQMTTKSSRTVRDLAAAARSMPRSGIREIMDIAWGVPDAIHLEVGEPNFETPPHIVDAAASALRSGATRYTPNAGIPELREALADKVSKRNALTAGMDDIIVTSGAVGALYTTLLSLLDPGDGVLVPDPGWPNFRMMANLIGAEVQPYPLKAEDGYAPRAERIRRSITDQTRVLLVNSPSNPLGTVLDPQEAEELLQLARERDLWVVSDECYDELVFDGASVSLGALDPDARVVSVFSFSKTYAMTGWRVGYAVAPKALAETLAKVQEPVISCVNSPGQHAALAALHGPQDAVTAMRNAYRSRRDLVMTALAEAGVSAQRPSGAFYVWLDVSETGLSSHEFARTLVVEDHVAVVPGTAFGDAGEGSVRISLATDSALLLEGVERMLRRYTALADGRT
jgi:aspartate aminotransferase